MESPHPYVPLNEIMRDPDYKRETIKEESDDEGNQQKLEDWDNYGRDLDDL